MLGMDFSRLRSIVESTYGLGLGSGRVFFVGASTDRWFVEEMVNSKLDGTVKTTVDSALSACESGRGDVVVVLPGRHTLTSAAVLPAGTRLLGVPGMREATIVISKLGENGLSVSNNNCLIQGLTFNVNGSKHGITVTGLRNSIKDCAFERVSGTPHSYLMVDGQAGSKGVGTRVADCFFGSHATTAFQLASDANDQIADVVIEGCIIKGATNGVLLPVHNFSEVIVNNNVFTHATNPINNTAGKTGDGSIVCHNYMGVANTDACASATFEPSTAWVGNYSVAGLSTADPA